MIAELAYPGTSMIAQYVYHGDIDHPFALATGNSGNPQIRYFFQDAVEGNMTAVMRDTITLHQYTEYGAWGEILRQPINVLADTNRLGWKGLMYEGDSTKLYYMRGRWYDPAAGRFVSEDPVGIVGGLNLYAFAANEPVSGLDPMGACRYGKLSDPFDFSDGEHNAKEGFKLPYRSYALACTGDDWDDPWKPWIANLPAVHVASNDNSDDFWSASNSDQVVSTLGSLLAPFNDAMTHGPTGMAVMFLISPVGESGGVAAETVGEWTMTRKVASHLTELVKYGSYKGELARPFMSSPLLIKEIMSSAEPIADQFSAGASKWTVPGLFRGREGVWELVIDGSNRILHFNFR
jgi:RHS repeat-associated protein